VNRLREYLKSLTVVFHECTSVLEGIIFNMAANMAPKMAKFHFKNLLSYKNAVVNKIAWFCQSMTCMHTQWRANYFLGFICFLSSYFEIHTLIRTIIYICINFCSFMFCNYVIFVYIVFVYNNTCLVRCFGTSRQGTGKLNKLWGI